MDLVFFLAEFGNFIQFFLVHSLVLTSDPERSIGKYSKQKLCQEKKMLREFVRIKKFGSICENVQICF